MQPYELKEIEWFCEYLLLGLIANNELVQIELEND